MTSEHQYTVPGILVLARSHLCLGHVQDDPYVAGLVHLSYQPTANPPCAFHPHESSIVMWAIPHQTAVRDSFWPRRPDHTLWRHSAQVFLTNSGSRLHANGRSLKSKVPAGIAVSPATRCLPRPSADASDSKPLRKMVESLQGVSLLPLPLLLLSFLFFSIVVLVASFRGGRRQLVVAGEHAASPIGDVHRTRAGRCFESEQAFLSALTRVAARTFSCVSRLSFDSSGSARCDTTGEDGSSSRSKRRSMPSVPSFDPSLLWFLHGACGIFNALRAKYV